MLARPCSRQRQAAPARASRSVSRTRLFAARIASFSAAATLLQLAAASSASAQVAVAASVFSDDRFRGYSLSNGHPVGILDLSYDAADGFYGAVSGSVLASRDGIQPLGLELNAGYAKQLTSALTVDLGAVHSDYSHYSSRRSGKAYTEAYLGLAGKLLSARVSVSPDYLSSGVWTVYGEVNGSLPVGSKLRFTGHIGLLRPLRRYSEGDIYRTELDWRLGLAREIGRVTLTASWTGVHPGRDVYQERHGHHALVLGVSCAF